MSFRDHETVFLDTLSWDEFEKLCAQIFEKLGYGKVREINLTNDEGRDVVIDGSDGRPIIIECKHQPNTSIGRPIIQKLHSAVVSGFAKQGFVITTGRFSEQAIQHAKTLRPPVELIDLPKLLALGDKAGISITSKAIGNVPIYHMIASNWNDLKIKCASLFEKFISFPSKAVDIAKLVPVSAELMPLYLVTFKIDQNFSTSVGLIHSIHVDYQSICISGADGKLLKPEIANFMAGSNLRTPSESLDFSCPTKRGDFNLDTTSLKSSAKKIIAQLYTRTISYSGGNYRSYSKMCIPSDQSIYIRDIKQFFLPIRQAKINILKQDYTSLFIESDTNVYYEAEKILVCKICNERIKNEPLLCNSCGKITCKPRFFKHHGASCHVCKKTICQACTYKKRRYLIFRKRICEACDRAETKS